MANLILFSRASRFCEMRDRARGRHDRQSFGTARPKDRGRHMRDPRYCATRQNQRAHLVERQMSSGNTRARRTGKRKHIGARLADSDRMANERYDHRNRDEQRNSQPRQRLHSYTKTHRRGERERYAREYPRAIAIGTLGR